VCNVTKGERNSGRAWVQVAPASGAGASRSGSRATMLRLLEVAAPVHPAQSVVLGDTPELRRIIGQQHPHHRHLGLGVVVGQRRHLAGLAPRLAATGTSPTATTPTRPRRSSARSVWTKNGPRGPCFLRSFSEEGSGVVRGSGKRGRGGCPLRRATSTRKAWFSARSWSMTAIVEEPSWLIKNRFGCSINSNFNWWTYSMKSNFASKLEE
jgi:hypothetical protein